MSSGEFAEWDALEEIDPWGQARDDYRLSYLCCLLASAMGFKQKDGAAFTPDHFRLPLPRLPVTVPVAKIAKPIAKEIPKQTVEEMEQWIKLWVRGSNRLMQERGIQQRRH